MPTVKKKRIIPVFLAAAIAVVLALISAGRTSDSISGGTSAQVCGSVITDGISSFGGFSISASESQVQLPRNSTFSPSPRQHSAGKRTWQFSGACTLLKGGKVHNAVSAGHYMTSMELFPSGLADQSGRFLFLMKLII